MAKKSRTTYRESEIDPDEIFLDSQNLPQFDNQQFEGRIEKPIPKYTVGVLGIVCLSALLILGWNIGNLQIARGQAFRERSENNRLRHIPFFAERGGIYDRNHRELVTNAPDREYTEKPGHAHLLGYIGYPSDEQIKQYGYGPEELVGKTGAEKIFGNVLRGSSGLKIVETDAAGNSISESVYEPPTPGKSIDLSIDSRVQTALYESIASVAEDRGFSGGAGIIMDVETGELLAITSYPEFQTKYLTGSYDKEIVQKYLNDPRKPFLERATNGVYTPGSIIKPFMALAALADNIISPEKEIISTGSISVPNPYFPDKKSVFTDWKAHGAVAMRRALAVSSNVYFYVIGGGFQGQKGVGIKNIEKYVRMFGFGERTGSDLESEAKGVVPSPEWKAANFDGEDWLLGDTYHTSIGQYGFGVTPLQVVRAVAAIANSGKLLTPTIEKDDTAKNIQILPIKEKDFQVVREGMRLAVAGGGTAAGLNMPDFAVGAKTGTAELGISKQRVNSWVTGFFPYEKPRYAFAIVMEKGERHNTIGGVFVARKLFEWMRTNTPEYTTPEIKERAEVEKEEKIVYTSQ